MAIIASALFPGSEFSERVREAGRRFQARMAKHNSSVDLTIVVVESGLLGVIVLPCMRWSLGKQVASAVMRRGGRSLQHLYVFFVLLLGRDKYERGGVQVRSMYA